MAKVSLTMIVKNEEANLPRCLSSVAGLPIHETIIVVDAGTTDRTREVALDYGARVYDDRWGDDYSAARNQSLRHASGDWFFWLDADDSFDAANRDKLGRLLEHLDGDVHAYVLYQQNELVPSLTNFLTSTSAGAAFLKKWRAVGHPKLVRMVPGVCFRHRIHEVPAWPVAGGEPIILDSGVSFRHRGYLDLATAERKVCRNRRIAVKDLLDHPDQKRSVAIFFRQYTETEIDPEPAPALWIEDGFYVPSCPLSSLFHRLSVDPKKLRAQLRRHPNDAAGWVVLTILHCRQGLQAQALRAARRGLSHCDSQALTDLEAELTRRGGGQPKDASECPDK